MYHPPLQVRGNEADHLFCELTFEHLVFVRHSRHQLFCWFVPNIQSFFPQYSSNGDYSGLHDLY